MRGDVLLGGCDPVAQRVWTGKHVGAREALAMDMSLHGRCRVQARRPWPNLEDDLAAVAFDGPTLVLIGEVVGLRVQDAVAEALAA